MHVFAPSNATHFCQGILGVCNQAELESRTVLTCDLCRLVDDMRAIDPRWEERGSDCTIPQSNRSLPVNGDNKR